VIIVDEEHDQAYKQDEGVKYNARDLAIVKGGLFRIPVVLGSATPSGESYFRAKTGEFRYLELPERVAQGSLPDVRIVDLTENRARRGFKRYVSSELEELIEATLARDEKVMLFINRRGFSPWILCLDCGFVERCGDCSVSLTPHRQEGALICHYCGMRKPVPIECPRCSGPKMAPIGIGTEKLEAFLNRKWKEQRVSRMDSDATRRRGVYGALLRSMQEGEIDILVGTQMIAKGHDFPQVTLVGVLLADLSLSFPDFRSSERTFQVLTQVSGRAGRRGTVGQVIIQTYQPDHYAILKAAAHKYSEFMDIELSHRSELGYPPFSRLLLIRVSGKDKAGVEKRAQEVAETLYFRFDSRTDLKILGPSPAPIWKIKKQYIYQILVKSSPDADFSPLMDVVNAEFGGGKRKGGIRVDFDVDPYQLMY
ncbi:MAG: primosomal protein N', partial [Deltaproteobacteria bacterium]|nr:primosomal protein N' [Deltaproteobacteria bacterium]NIS78490.1 primosomal protein N' [Deltaproteobacteria bacterium]